MEETIAEQKYKVERISFSTLRDYWIEVDHFQDPNKKYDEVLSHLGPYKSTFADPRRFSYGLFEGGKLIGVTHITQWNREWIRFRTINIRKEYRGQGLSYHLIEKAVALDWQDEKFLFGWFRRSAYDWAIKHGFRPIDHIWYDGTHTGLLKPIGSIV